MTALDFELRPELEAHEPAEMRGSGRDDVRMIVSDRASGRVIDTHFRALPEFLRDGDLLVLNTSATLPAALVALRENGDEIALHWSTSLPGGLHVIEPRLGAPPSAGSRSPTKAGTPLPARASEVLTLPGGAHATLLTPYRDSQRLWIARLDIDVPIADYLRRWGRPIRYPYVDRRFPIDAYQNVFARIEGSAEMPSAGRAFTRSMLACLRARGVGIARLVLHTGVASLESNEKPYEEWYEVPHRTAQRVRDAKHNGRARTRNERRRERRRRRLARLDGSRHLARSRRARRRRTADRPARAARVASRHARSDRRPRDDRKSVRRRARARISMARVRGRAFDRLVSWTRMSSAEENVASMDAAAREKRLAY